MNIYYQHVNGLKTVATNMTVGANGTASIEVRAENKVFIFKEKAPARAFSWLKAPAR